MPASLSEFLRKYHKLSAAEDSAKLQRLFMLAELHPLSVVWQVGRYVTWKTFLRAEQLCPAPQLESFELAMTLYKKPVLERIGADAAIVLARAEPHLRALALKRIEKYIESHEMRPKGPMVWAFVRALRKEVVVVGRSKGRGKPMTYATRH